MAYYENSPFEEPDRNYIKHKIRDSLSKLNKESRVEFVLDLVNQINPDISTQECERYLDNSLVQVI